MLSSRKVYKNHCCPHCTSLLYVSFCWSPFALRVAILPKKNQALIHVSLTLIGQVVSQSMANPNPIKWATSRLRNSNFLEQPTSPMLCLGWLTDFSQWNCNDDKCYMACQVCQSGARSGSIHNVPLLVKYNASEKHTGDSSLIHYNCSEWTDIVFLCSKVSLTLWPLRWH